MTMELCEVLLYIREVAAYNYDCEAFKHRLDLEHCGQL